LDKGNSKFISISPMDQWLELFSSNNLSNSVTSSNNRCNIQLKQSHPSP
jgi:hypothetical protein